MPMTPDEVAKMLEELNCILADKQWVTEKQHESVESAISLIQELQRLKSREGNAKIELCYDDGKNPFARESLKIVDFGYSDNIYIVESSLIQDYQKLREKLTVEKLIVTIGKKLGIHKEQDLLKYQIWSDGAKDIAQAIVTYLQQPTEH